MLDKQNIIDNLNDNRSSKLSGQRVEQRAHVETAYKSADPPAKLIIEKWEFVQVTAEKLRFHPHQDTAFGIQPSRIQHSREPITKVSQQAHPAEPMLSSQEYRSQRPPQRSTELIVSWIN